MRTHLLGATAVAAALLAATSSTHAQTNWTGAVSSDWFATLNWNAGVPTAGTSANIDTVSPNPTVVASPGGTALNLAIGQSGTGRLTIQSGGMVTDVFGAVGNLPGSQGTVTVSGAGSMWTTIGNVVVGGQSTGTVTIQNGGTVNSAGGGSVGLAVGSTGTVMVTGPGSSWNNGPGGGLNIGSFGTGTLTIANGGMVINNTAFTANIGNGAGSQGTVTVTGAGSTWSNSSGVNIGNLGTGTLTLVDGGTLTDGMGAIGGAPGSQGVVTVTGAGSTWTNTASLLVGGNATGTLTIAAGGTVTSVGGAIGIGGAGFGSQGTVLITGQGSSWSSSPGIEVGTLGGTGALTIADGGVASGPIFIASTAGSIGTVNIGAATGNPADAPGTLNTTSVAFGAGTGALNFNHTSNNYVFEPAISGNGAVNVLAGITMLTANNTYTGPTTISGGALIVSGSIASSSLTTVNNRTALLGSGTVGSTVVNSGGFLIPGQVGTPGSSMTVAGNLAFQSGAAYIVQVNPATASTTNVSGTASLAGRVGAIFAPGSYVERSYTILTATGGRTGTFDALLTSGLPTNFTASVSYTTNTAMLNLTAHLVPSVPLVPLVPSTPTTPSVPLNPPTPSVPLTGLNPSTPLPPPSPLNPSIPGLPAAPEDPLSPPPAPPPPFTVNQFNVGHAIDNFFNNGGALPPAFVSLYDLTGSSLTSALDQLSGEPATGAQKVAFQLTDQFLNLMLDPFVDGRSAGVCTAYPVRALGFAPARESVPPELALGYAPMLKEPKAPMPVCDTSRLTMWGGAYGAGNHTSGDLTVIGSHDLSARTVGLAAGLDYHLTPDTVVGFALAGGGTNWSLSQGLGGGNSDAFQAGIYGTTRWGPAYLAADFAFTNHWMSTDRIAVGDHLTADFNAQSYGGRLEGGYRFGVFDGGITPYAAIQAQSFHTPGYTETDPIANGFALAFASRDGTDTRSELGARFDRVLAVYSNAVLALRGRAAWAHAWVSDPTLVPVFQALPGASFIVNGAVLPHDSALASAGGELRFANGITLLAKFDGEFASQSSTYGGTGTFRYRW
jgi:T5SS/PEP-CTERM-associated repeat protein